MAKANNKFKRICVLAKKGGVGKTAIATNIAAVISKYYEEETCLLDLDPEGNLAFLLGVPEETSLAYPIFLGKKVESYEIAKHLSLFAGSDDLERETVKRSPESTLKMELDDAQAHIVMDTNPNIAYLENQALNLCDHALIVTDPDLASVNGAVKKAEVIDRRNKMLKKDRQRTIRYGFIINRYKKNGIMSKEINDIILKTYPEADVFYISNLDAIQQVRYAEQLITESSKTKKIVNETQAIVEWIME